MKNIFFILLLASTTASALPCQPTNRGMQTMQRAQIIIINNHAQPLPVNTLVADDNLERASGYQYICPRIINQTTILFRWDKPLHSAFHMNNVTAPLDIGFFDADGILIQAMAMYPYKGDEQTLYAPMKSFQYALEARLGFFKQKNLSAGRARLQLDSLP